MKREAAFNTTFNHWIKGVCKHIFVFKIPDCGFQNPFDCFSVDRDGKFFAWELKQTQSNSMAFSAVVPHQVLALRKTNGYVVIKYPKFFCTIHVNDWINEMRHADRKSLTAQRALEISTKVVEM